MGAAVVVGPNAASAAVNGRAAATLVGLPGGWWCDGVCHRQAELRPVDDADADFLFDLEASAAPSAARTSALLVRCLVRLGPLAPATPAAVRALTIGDREALLLHLRRLTFGDRLRCLVSCPASACAERLELELELGIGDLLLPPYPHPRLVHEATVGGNGHARRVRFRLPIGADQEVVAAVARANPQAAVDLVLRRCLAGSGEGEEIGEVDPEVARALPAIMAELDPQAELTLNLTCPACGWTFAALFDTGAFLFQELAERMRRLCHEVHLLAWHYHWSEAAIVAMGPHKRRRYLDLVSAAIVTGGPR